MSTGLPIGVDGPKSFDYISREAKRLLPLVEKISARVLDLRSIATMFPWLRVPNEDTQIAAVDSWRSLCDTQME